MSKKILIIEDDTFLQGLAANKLSDAGFEVTTASDGDEAVTELSKEKFNCILLDLMLPDISGFDILKSIRETSKSLPVIVFSNLSDDKDIKKALDLGATDYLVKSNFTLEELVEKIEKTI
jgi:two-component system alkaline phosphatase synthesis response regulator PhoP